MTAESLDDLVAQLKIDAEYHGDHTAYTTDKAIDAIVALRARAERAEEVADAQTKGVYSKHMLEAADAKSNDRWQRMRIAELEAEVVALREALRKWCVEPIFGEPSKVCRQCDSAWNVGDAEYHAVGCLAEKDKGG